MRVAADDNDLGPRAAARWFLTDAHVVARSEDGGVEAIHRIDVEIEEGREELISDVDDERFASCMRYCFAVRPRGVMEADAWVGSDAFVTIVGRANDGSTVTLSGHGIFSRTGAATFEAEYAELPSMTTWCPARSASKE